MKRLWQEHSLSIVLISVFISMSVAYWFLGQADWRADELAHGNKQPAIWPDYATHYAAEMMVSNVADVFGAIILVLFTKWFWERDSAES